MKIIRFRRQLLRSVSWFLGTTLMLAGGLLLYACAGKSALRREIKKTPRNPKTGVVLGAEALTLEPPRTKDEPTTACLLIHGFNGSRKDYADMGERLAAKGFHVRLVRLPGHGTTPEDFARQTPETIYAGVLGEYQELRKHYKTVDVIGFSMGGALGTLLASRTDVHRLVLVAPYYGVTYEWYYLLPPATWNMLLSPMIPYVIKFDCFSQCNRREAVPNIYSYHCVSTRGVSTLVALGKSAAAPKTLGAVHCPALMLISVGDRASSPACARRAFARLGSPEKYAHWLTARSNHILFWDYDREEVKSAVEQFLTGAAPAQLNNQKVVLAGK